jgi:hypothetical protein
MQDSCVVQEVKPLHTTHRIASHRIAADARCQMPDARWMIRKRSSIPSRGSEVLDSG